MATRSDRYNAVINSYFLNEHVHNLRGPSDPVKKIIREADRIRADIRYEDYKQCPRLEIIKEEMTKLGEAYQSPFWKMWPKYDQMIKDYKVCSDYVSKLDENLDCERY